MLLPQDRVFDLTDFELLAEMEMDSKLMPPEDVEAALRMIHTSADKVDLTTPSGREEMAYELAKFISSPGRRLKETLARKEEERQEVERSAQLALEAAARQREKEINALAEAHQAELQRLSTVHDEQSENLRRQMSIIASELAEMKRVYAESQETAVRQALRRSAYVRLGCVGVLLLCIMCVCTYIALRFGKPQGDFQKLMDADKLFGVGMAVWAVCSVFIMGSRERMAALTWPIRRLFKVEGASTNT